MNLSLQAQGGRISAPASRAYPFRCVVLEQWADGLWSIASVFEMETAEAADLTGLECCTEPYAMGIIAMHYYVGEVG